jgi:hypothetical protein
MSKRARSIRVIQRILVGYTLGWLASAIWLNPPIEESDAIVVFVDLLIILILSFVDHLDD